MMLRFLDSRYPGIVEYKELEKVMEAINCSPQKLARVLAYLKEKQFIGGDVETQNYWWENIIDCTKIKITANGIDYLEELEESIRLKVEETEKEIGFKPYSQKQGRKEKKDTSTERTA